MDSRVSDALVAIRRIVRAAEFASRDLTRATGLTPSQLIVMQIVARAGEPGAGAIAEAARLSQATVTALLDKLEARNFISRRKTHPDRRRITVTLTEAGRRALAETPDLLQDRFSARFTKLPDYEQASIIAALERVSALMDAEGIDASPVLDVGQLD